MNPDDMVRRGVRLDDPTLAAAIEQKNDPAFWWGYYAAMAVQRRLPLDDPSLADAIARSNNPAYWWGQAALDAVNAGVKVDDKIVADAIARSEYQDYWWEKCEKASKRRKSLWRSQKRQAACIPTIQRSSNTRNAR